MTHNALLDLPFNCRSQFVLHMAVDCAVPVWWTLEIRRHQCVVWRMDFHIEIQGKTGESRIFKWGGGGQRIIRAAHNTSAKHGLQWSPLKGPWSWRVLDALLCYPRPILMDSDTKQNTQKTHSPSKKKNFFFGGGGTPVAPMGQSMGLGQILWHNRTRKMYCSLQTLKFVLMLYL